MAKLRVLMLFLTILVVGTTLYFAGLYARGYRYNSLERKFTPRGLLVVKSNPDGAQVYIDGKLNTATNNTIALSPGSYKVEIKKQGYFTWEKTLEIEKEIVTEADAFLFKTAASLSPLTFGSAKTPVVSKDLTKIAFTNTNDEGLWIIDLGSSPLNFSKDPKQITDISVKNYEYQFSPDGRQILLTSKANTFLLDSNVFVEKRLMVPLTKEPEEITMEWKLLEEEKLMANLKNLPKEMQLILEKNASNVTFSFDGNKVIYIAKDNATIPSELIKPFPGDSTQKEEREIKGGKVYVYDIKEDKNFMISKKENGELVFFFPTSKHIVYVEKDKISILEYDGTNKQVVLNSGFVYPYAFATTSQDRLVILTNFGNKEDTYNLYTVSVR